MRWPWSKREAPPAIPPHKVEVKREHAEPEPLIEVEEIDTSEMTKTGVHRAWDKLAGKFK